MFLRRNCSSGINPFAAKHALKDYSNVSWPELSSDRFEYARERSLNPNLPGVSRAETALGHKQMPAPFLEDSCVPTATPKSDVSTATVQPYSPGATAKICAGAATAKSGSCLSHQPALLGLALLPRRPLSNLRASQRVLCGKSV